MYTHTHMCACLAGVYPEGKCFLNISEHFQHFHTYGTHKHHIKFHKTRLWKGIAYRMKYDMVDSPYSMRSEFRSNYQMAELNTENPYVWWQLGTAVDILAFPAKCLSRCRVLHFNITIWHKNPGEELYAGIKGNLKGHCWILPSSHHMWRAEGVKERDLFFLPFAQMLIQS